MNDQSTPPSATPPGKAATPPETKKTSGPRRSKFADIYPNSAKVKLLVDKNPKKEGSACRDRFDAYTGSATVGEYLAKGGTYQDIAYDIGRQFVEITRDKAAEKVAADAAKAAEKEAADAKAAKEKATADAKAAAAK